MACAGEAYAEAWEYADYWAVAALQMSVDDSGGVGNASLQDSQANFNEAGLRPNVGMILYNLGQGASPTITSGPVTAVTVTTLTATGVTWDDGDVYRIVGINTSQIATINNFLRITAPKIDIVRASVGACNCTLSAPGAALMSLLNIIYTGLNHFAVCGMPGQHLDTDQKRLLLEDVNAQLALIYSGDTELCEGETGSTLPIIGWSSQGLTPFGAAEIIANAESA